MARSSQSQVRAWALALDLVYGTVAGGVVGYVLDTFVFHTTPWLTLSLSLVMLVGGMVRFIKAANRLNASFSKDARAGRFGTGATWDGQEPEGEPGAGDDQSERRV